jgi:hypothetical protein
VSTDFRNRLYAKGASMDGYTISNLQRVWITKRATVIVAVTIISFLILMDCSTTWAQHQHLVHADCQCTQIKKDAHKLSISYESVETDEAISEEGRFVSLRLQNNTSCAIYVPTSYEYLRKTQDGYYSFDVENGAVVSVNYEIEGAKRTRREKKRPPYAGRAIYAARLPAGHTLIFKVPLNAFERKVRISVPYRCNRNEKLNRTAPRLYFESKSLPAGLQSKLIH